MIGERIRLVRDYLAITQQQLAAAASVSQPAISKVERGGSIKPETLRSISGATGYSMEFFTQGALPDVPELSLRFRKRATSLRKDDKRLRALCRQAVELVSKVEDQVELPPVGLKPHYEDVNDTEIENLAVAVRQRLGIGATDRIPNLTTAVERSGIVVFGASGSLRKHDAASVWPSFPVGRPVVCYTRGWPGDRQRLSIAHEVAHLLLHQTGLIDPDRAERDAFRFGAALLLPREAALEEIQPPVLLHRLRWAKAKWGISIGALIRRARDLNIIDSYRYTSLMKQRAVRGWHKNEPVEVPVEQPVLLAKSFRLVYGTDRPTAVAAKTGLAPMAIRDLIGPMISHAPHRVQPATIHRIGH